MFFNAYMKLQHTAQVCKFYSTLFLKHGGQISVEVTGTRINKDIKLEIPVSYTFYYKKP